MTVRLAIRYAETWTCSAPDALFCDDWESLGKDILDIVERQHGLACDGGGRPGGWCMRCHWGNVQDMTDDEVDL